MMALARGNTKNEDFTKLPADSSECTPQYDGRKWVSCRRICLSYDCNCMPCTEVL